MKIRFSVNWPSNALHIMDCISGFRPEPGILTDYDDMYHLTRADERKGRQFLDARRRHVVALDTAFNCNKYDNALRIAATLPGNEADLFLGAMQHFRDNSYEYYRSQREMLRRRARALSRSKKLLDLEKMARKGFEFFNSSCPEEAVVHLLINTSGGEYSGRANIHPQNTIGNAKELHVTLMPNHLETSGKDVISCDLDVDCHEFLHSARRLVHPVQETRFKELTGRDDGIIEESVIDTLCPGAALSLKYGLCKSLSRDFTREWKIPAVTDMDYEAIVRAALAYKLYPMTRKWLQQGKTVFQDDYLNTARKMLDEIRAG